MIKKIKRIFINFHEWIFKRKELLKFKTQANLLEKEVDGKTKEIEAGNEVLEMLYAGVAVRLTHQEKRMIIDAIEYVPFREAIELPETKAYIRITWRGLREKIRRHLKWDPSPAEIGEAPKRELEAKEGDETKAGDNG